LALALAGCNAITGADHLSAARDDTPSNDASVDRNIDGDEEAGEASDANATGHDGHDAGDVVVERDGTADAGWKVVFVTSATSSGNLGGLAGADQICTAAANTGPLAGHTFVAWLSVAGEDAIHRITHDGPYNMLDGRTIVTDKSQLASGSIASPIEIDEHGAKIDESADDKVRVWTGTSPTGTVLTSTCTNWTTGNLVVFGTLGSAILTDGNWTHAADKVSGTGWGCQTLGHIYCFEQ
jgi:hypothetical protein